MHILLAFITAVASLLFVLTRFGVDIHSLNPFLWHRRSQWRKKYQAKPIHTLKRPVEAAAVLIVGTVKSEGLISREQKSALLEIFHNDLKQDAAAANDLLGATAFMLSDVMDLVPEVPHILAPSKALFTEEQSQSLLALLRKAATIEGSITPQQQAIIEAVERELIQDKRKPGEW
jgi:hypothetical protein